MSNSNYVMLDEVLLTPIPSDRLVSFVQQHRADVLECLRYRGMQPLSCHNNAAVWCEVLSPRWKATAVSGWACLPRVLWHEAFGRWLARVPHTWVEVQDGDKIIKLDGSYQQFKGLLPTHVKED